MYYRFLNNQVWHFKNMNKNLFKQQKLLYFNFEKKFSYQNHDKNSGEKMFRIKQIEHQCKYLFYSWTNLKISKKIDIKCSVNKLMLSNWKTYDFVLHSIIILMQTICIILKWSMKYIKAIVCLLIFVKCTYKTHVKRLWVICKRSLKKVIHVKIFLKIIIVFI